MAQRLGGVGRNKITGGLELNVIWWFARAEERAQTESLYGFVTGSRHFGVFLSTQRSPRPSNVRGFLASMFGQLMTRPGQLHGSPAPRRRLRRMENGEPYFHPFHQPLDL